MKTIMKSEAVKHVLLGSALVMALMSTAFAQSSHAQTHRSAQAPASQPAEQDHTTKPGWSPSWSYTNNGPAPYDYNNRYGTFGDQ
ncbi:hypothetical protein [Beijerinckia indica]|uniref:Lipoprotein n=1 Tax=Beijerinckia indica subsp. indica (strain ATCC 9039 / DSM 1715 / NCIMB 8712) TaxID=395963 RepID=B2IDR6_BEII9|nr:hypothetical protein [Beijerinckia indica]ACB96848.1 hypothetical protein Bind_3289 [Beijerinckia indica subsp. indica ATCC 9039]